MKSGLDIVSSKGILLIALYSGAASALVLLRAPTLRQETSRLGLPRVLANNTTVAHGCLVGDVVLC